MNDYGMNSSARIYTSLWAKYKPVILKMMVEADAAPQQYQLFDHEFANLDTRKKKVFTFELAVEQGKARGIKDSIIAQNLWEILQSSKKAGEMISTAKFQFSLDKRFVLRVEKIENNV